MTRFTLAALAALVLSGCGGLAVYESPTQSYRFKGEDRPVTITGAIDRDDKFTSVTHSLKVRFNGEVAASGPLSSRGIGSVFGTWRGHAVESICSRVEGSSGDGSYTVNCIVVVDNERTVTLTF